MAVLTDKQERFCQEHIIDLSKRKAAIRAGYRENTAAEQASRLLTYVKIKERISELMEKRAEAVDITQQEVLLELKNFFYSDITEAIELSPSEVKELPAELRRMVSGFKHTTRKIAGSDGDAGLVEEVIEIKFYDKLRALDMINRHIGLYEKDNKQSAPTFNNNSEIVFTDGSTDD